MPLDRKTVLTGGAEYATLGLFIGPVDHTATVKVDISALNTSVVDSKGYLKPGTPFNKNGLLITGLSGIHQFVAAGAAAGDVVVTGIKAADRLLSVVRVNLDATAANIDVDDLTSEFSVTADDTINNAAGTNTTGDKLIVTYAVEDQYAHGVVMEPVLVADSNATADLNAATDFDVVLATIGQVNQKLVEDNLGRVLNANELAGFTANGSLLRLVS